MPNGPTPSTEISGNQSPSPGVYLLRSTTADGSIKFCSVCVRIFGTNGKQGQKRGGFTSSGCFTSRAVSPSLVVLISTSPELNRILYPTNMPSPSEPATPLREKGSKFDAGDTNNSASTNAAEPASPSSDGDAALGELCGTIPALVVHAQQSRVLQRTSPTCEPVRTRQRTARNRTRRDDVLSLKSWRWCDLHRRRHCFRGMKKSAGDDTTTIMVLACRSRGIHSSRPAGRDVFGYNQQSLASQNEQIWAWQGVSASCRRIG